MRTRVLVALVLSFSVVHPVAAEVLRCAVACAEMRALEGNPPPSIPADATDLERRRAQLRNADRAGADANARFYIEAQAARYAGAAIGGVDGSGWVGPAVGATSEAFTHFSEVALQTYYDRRVDHLGAAMDQQLDGLLRKDGKITAEELVEYKERVEGLLYDRKFVGEFDNEMKEVFSDTQGRVNFDLLVKSFATGREIQGTVAGLDKKADEAKRQLRIVDKHVREGITILNHGMQEGFTALGLGQATLSGQVDLNRKLLETQLTPRQKLELANQNQITVGAEDYKKLVRVVQAENIQAFRGQVNQASAALRSMGLDPKLDEFVGNATQLMDVSLNLAASLTDPTGFGVAMGVMNMVGVVRGFGRKSGPSAEARMLRRVLEELHAMRKEMREYHEQQMKMLGEIRRDVYLLHKDMLERFQTMNERLVYVQLGVQESLTKDVMVCDDIKLEDSPAYRDPTQRSLDGFRRWWERERLTQPYHTCTEGLTSVVNSWFVLNGKPSRAFIAVTGAAGSNQDSALSADEVQSFRRRVWDPTVSYTQLYLSSQPAEVQAQARSRVYIPSAQIASIAALEEAGSLAAWTPPVQLPAATFFAPVGRDLFAAEPMITVSSFVRTVAYAAGLLYEENGTLRPITESAVSRGQGAGYPSRFRDLTRNMETQIRAALAQEHVLAGTPMLEFAADVIDQQVIPMYYAARFSGAWPALESHLQKSASEQSESCITGDAVFDTLCVMQANPMFADSVMRAVMARRIARSGTLALASYEAALQGASTKALRTHVGDDVVLSDSASPADFPSIKAAYAATPGSSWALELPRAFARGEPTKIHETLKAPTDLQSPQLCWTDPPKDFSLQSELNVERAGQIQRRWSRCYMLPAANTIASGELRTRPSFTALASELRQLHRTYAYQIDPRQAPEGMRDLIEIASWAQSSDPAAVRLKENACPACRH